MNKSVEAFDVIIMSPDELLWKGKAQSITSENSAGPFDILARHANFVTMIKNKPIFLKTDTGEVKSFTYSNAVLAVDSNKITVYSDI